MGLSYGPPTSVRGVLALLVLVLVVVGAFYLSAGAAIVFALLCIAIAVVGYALGIRGFRWLGGMA